jgi:hypothetical protein
MRDAQGILQAVLLRIRHVYNRPLMYGGTPEAVDTLLHWYHEMWAVIVEAERAFERVELSVHMETGPVAAGFATVYRRRRPQSTDKQVARYVVRKWSQIDSRLGISLPDLPKVEPEIDILLEFLESRKGIGSIDQGDRASGAGGYGGKP